MTWDRSLYPDNWGTIAHQVKQEANWHCEECGRPCRKPGEKIQDHYARIKAKNHLGRTAAIACLITPTTRP